MLLPDALRFWSKVNKGEQCLEWTASKSKLGYGRFTLSYMGKDETHYAHRISWMLHFGEIPDGMCICHKCDNPKCVNPNHLFIGSKSDNNKDRAAKGRSYRKKFA